MKECGVTVAIRSRDDDILRDNVSPSRRRHATVGSQARDSGKGDEFAPGGVLLGTDRRVRDPSVLAPAEQAQRPAAGAGRGPYVFFELLVKVS